MVLSPHEIRGDGLGQIWPSPEDIFWFTIEKGFKANINEF
jgi:hypothetical protein